MPGVVYTVYAADAVGHIYNCSGTNSCNLKTLNCGTGYNVTITPSRNDCVGRTSPTKLITTGKQKSIDTTFVQKHDYQVQNDGITNSILCLLLSAVPCVPQLSDVEMDCLSNSAFAIFNATAGAEEYVITATNSQGVIQTLGCNFTVDGACSLPQLMCSQNLTFTVQAKDQQCTSARSNAVKTETGKYKYKKPFNR